MLIKYCKMISTGQLVFSVNAEQPDAQVMASALSMEGVVEADVEIGTMSFDDFRDARKKWDLEHLSTEEKRKASYPNWHEFAEAYTEKEIGSNSTKWDAYVINYNKVRTENPK
jgi:hypothetical protein